MAVACDADGRCTLGIPAAFLGDFNEALADMPTSVALERLGWADPLGCVPSVSDRWLDPWFALIGVSDCRCMPFIGWTCRRGLPSKPPLGGRAAAPSGDEGEGLGC